MRSDTVLVFAVGLVLGAGAHAFWVALGTPAAPAASGAGASAAVAAASAERAGASAGASSGPTGSPPAAGSARPAAASGAGANSATSHSLSDRPASPTASSAAAVASAQSESGAQTPGADAAATVTATATATAKAALSGSADEAINAFRALAKEGLQAFGKAGTLVEKFKALDAEGISILSEMLRDPSSTTRFLAGAILEGLKDPRSIAALDAACADPDVLVQRMASHALAVMEAKDAAPALERAMNEGADWGARANAAYGLAKLGERSGRDYLLAMWRDKANPVGPLVAVGAMADVGSPEFSAELRPMIGNPSLDLGLRLQATLCAAKAKDRDALPLLEGAIASPDSPDSLKDAARKAVNEITGEARYKVD